MRHFDWFQGGLWGLKLAKMAVFLLKQVLTLLYPPAAQTDAKSGLRAINHLYKKGFFIALGHLCQTLSYPGFLGVKIPVLCSDFRRFLTEVTKLPQHNIYLWYFFGLNHHFHLIGASFYDVQMALGPSYSFRKILILVPF